MTESLRSVKAAEAVRRAELADLAQAEQLAASVETRQAAGGEEAVEVEAVVAAELLPPKEALNGQHGHLKKGGRE